MLQELESRIKCIKEGMSVEFPQLSEDSLNAIYVYAYEFYNGGKYCEALDLFQFLTVSNPLETRNWIGLAASHQMMRQFEQAIECYSVAAIQNPGNPYIHLYATDCFLTLNLQDQAKIAITSAEKAAENDLAYGHLLHHIKLIKNAWNKEQTYDKN